MTSSVKVSLTCALVGVFAFSFFSLTHHATAGFGGGREKIFACRVLSSDYLRMVSSPEDCSSMTEEPVEWRVGPEDGTEFPYVCQSCSLSTVDRFAGRNLTNAWFKASNVSYVPFTDTNLTSSTFAGADLNHSDFTGANLTDVDFSDANLTGATGMASTTRSGIIWGNTVCPDGTNSEYHDATCEDHLEL